MTKKPNKREYQELLTRYLEGKCTKEELETLNRWYESFDGDSGDTEIPAADNFLELKSEMFENITKGIHAAEAQSKNPHNGETPRRKAKVIRFLPLKRMAAIITVGIGVGIYILSQQFDFRQGRPDNAVKTIDESISEQRPKVNGPATIYLSDGSVVWLTAKSTLEYAVMFTDGVREVKLIGEAFFDVAKDRERPFVIHSTNFTTRVLGTSFKIKDHEDEESKEVAVVTGKVMVSVKGAFTDSVKNIILKSNRKAVYSKKDNSLVEFPVAEGLGEKLPAKSKLEFNEVPLKDIVKVLNVTHGVNITVPNERMKNCIITADLTNETIDVSIAILAKAINAEITVREKDIVLIGDGCVDSK